MQIVSYSEKYYLDVVAIVNNFYEESLREYDNDTDMDKDTLCNTIISIGSHPDNVFLLISDDKCEGIMAGTEVKGMLNTKRIWQEVIWYVNDGFRSAGVRLFKHVMKLLKDRGYQTVVMAVMENSKADKIKRLYGRMGFRPFEMHYIKAL